MVQDKTSVSRRHIVQAASVTLATTSLATSTAKGNAMAEHDLINPVTRYPKPPFKKRSQPWPGLAGWSRLQITARAATRARAVSLAARR